MTLRLNGSTSGYVELDAPAVAGTSALTLPASSGTVATTAYADTAGGLVLVTSETFSAVGSISINSCFSATYQNYRVIVSGTAIDAQLYMRLRASGSDSSSAYEVDVYYVGGSPGPSTINANSEWRLTYPGGTSGTWSAAFDLTRPFAASPTTLSGFGTNALGAAFMGYVHTTSSAYDGFTLFGVSGNITGTVRVYGYRN